ncbi:hypothetical protein [Methylibium petroleiphilum]|uniref:hypothetical protein n=1 Tax=Methylibium petroleiphilum TaxID=105560 RepID=UPI001ACEE43B|nr:hypothetical protein [Methylibium petroleiphilum]MBN9206816.1 hypothetical protein [Methylibium petroleiphilum]
MDYQPFPPSPFASLISPSEIVRALEGSEALERLNRRVCRPLDKPMLTSRLPAELARHDQAVDEEFDGPDAVSPRLTVRAMLSSGNLHDIVRSGSPDASGVDPGPQLAR